MANEQPQISSGKQDQIIAVRVMLLISFLFPDLIVQFNRHLLFFINVFELHKPSDFLFFFFLAESQKLREQYILHPIWFPSTQ
jgi:hypothetical protein